MEARSGLPNVVIAVAQEFTKDVDSHDTKTCVGFDLENG